MKAILCIYHGHCDDGFAAAWCVRRALGAEAVEFYPGVYQQQPPDVRGRDVLLVDFSYKEPVMREICTNARAVLVLDHHKTAAADLAFMSPPGAVEALSWRTATAGNQPMPTWSAVFDMERSGAGIAWDFFFPNTPRDPFIDYIEDRDLWRKALSGGDEFTIALRSYPQDFEFWDTIIADGIARLTNEGLSIQRYYRLRVEELKRSAYRAVIDYDGGIAGTMSAPVMVANAPYFAASEVAGELAECDGVEFGACYFEAGAGRWQYSLRSRGDFDVSWIARCYGGGGHKNAAGFTANRPVHRAPTPPKAGVEVEQ